jgi:hypothetical protein
VQVVANRVDPPPGALGDVADRLRLLYPVMARLLAQFSRGAAVLHVQGSLVAQGAALYAALYQSVVPATDEEQQDLNNLRARLGPPRSAADAMDHPEIALLRGKLATFLGS